MNKAPTKMFKFNYGMYAQLSIPDLKRMYRGINISTDHEFLTLLFLTSFKFKKYLTETFPDKFIGIDSKDEGYEEEIGIAISRIMWNITPIQITELTTFVDNEVGRWLEWAHAKHDPNSFPVVLLRYIVGRAIIFKYDYAVETADVSH